MLTSCVPISGQQLPFSASLSVILKAKQADVFTCTCLVFQFLRRAFPLRIRQPATSLRDFANRKNPAMCDGFFVQYTHSDKTNFCNGHLGAIQVLRNADGGWESVKFSGKKRYERCKVQRY